MGDPSAHPVYRALTWLYPRDFRNRYRDDLVQIHADLTREHGPARACGRTTLDLLVTVPRYRMENLMKESLSPTVLTVAIAAMALAGIASVFLTDGYADAVLLTPLAIVLAVTQRSKLAKSMVVASGSDVRRRRLTIAGRLTVSLLVIWFAGPLILGDHWGIDAIALFGLWFVLFVAAVVYFIAGIATPRTPATQH
jgi:hypothetical protein